jgi:hypothetical protein
MRHNFLGGVLVFAAAILFLAGPSQAHHGDAGRYNDEVSTVVGVVAQWRLINPHSVLILDVEDEDGNVVRWRGELGNPTTLASRYGWDQETFKPGDGITMTGRALKNGSPAMTLSEGSIVINTDTGEELFRAR